MFSEEQKHTHYALGDVITAYQKHKTKVQHCYNALKSPGIYRHYTPQEYLEIIKASEEEMEQIKTAYIEVMQGMLSKIINYNHVEEIEIV